MNFEELAFQSKMIEFHKAERFKDRLIASAFNGYQQYLMNGGKVVPFQKYLEDLGLSVDDIKLTKQDKQRIAENAYKTGERVMKMFKGKIK